MQRAGRGSWSVSAKVGDGAANSNAEGDAVIDIESLDSSFYLMTYDQTPDAHVTKSGAYRIEASIRCLPGHSLREAPYASIALNWQRGRSTVTAPCFLAVALTSNAWRVEQYADGAQVTLAEVRDASLKPGGSFQKVVIELKRFELSPLEDAADGEGGGGALVPARPPFTGGDPKLVELIEGEMLETSPQVAWDAIGGLADAKRLLNEAVVLPLLIPDYFAAAACRSTWKGVLLFGPPGTGKTLLARAVASLGKTAFFNISASSLVSKYHGESEKLVRTLFALARHHAPSVIFFDEVDALVSSRGMAGEHEASRRLKSELLSQMDGVSGGSSSDGLVMVLATSNKPWDLDEAMRRRLERRIYVPLPDETSRREMLQIHLKGLALAQDVDEEELGRRSAGYSGADLQLACRDASMMPMRRAVEGKSPLEIVEMQSRGDLEAEISAADFEAALARTQPSTNAQEQTMYEQWNEEFGCK